MAHPIVCIATVVSPVPLGPEASLYLWQSVFSLPIKGNTMLIFKDLVYDLTFYASKPKQ